MAPANTRLTGTPTGALARRLEPSSCQRPGNVPDASGSLGRKISGEHSPEKDLARDTGSQSQGLKIGPVPAGSQRMNPSRGLIAERVSMDKIGRYTMSSARRWSMLQTRAENAVSQLEWSPEAAQLTARPEVGDAPTSPRFSAPTGSTRAKTRSTKGVC